MKSLISCFVILWVVTLSSCTKPEPVPEKEPAPKDEVELLREQYSLYQKKSTELKDEYGFRYFSCDGVGFSVMAAWGFADPIDLGSVQREPGKYVRRPAIYGECYPRNSKSEMSRDHILRIVWILHRSGACREIAEINDYLESHNYTLGKGYHSRTFVNPSLYTTFKLVEVAHCGGKWEGKRVPYVPTNSPGKEAYANELAALHILLRSEVEGVTPHYRAWLDSKINSEPRNPLWRVIYWKITKERLEGALEALRGDEWPQDRLPTSREHCETWVTQRAPGNDWEPCYHGNGTVELHPAGEWGWLARLILEEYGR